ncbi:MAG: G-D-S-L family lipolytic protein [Gammaproteobacteria bacterium]|nr:G-D-S-L family lipolytic protein [Gammaproteobacteria bacterium]
MKNQIIKLLSVVTACAAIAACDADFENPVQGNAGNSGDADLSKFVTIGDSLTAGYADGALYKSGQEDSYPAILAQQFAKVGGDANFTQPLVSDDLGGLLAGVIQITDNRLVLNLTDPDSPSPEVVAGTPTTEVMSNLGGTYYSNLGVPGAKSFHLGAPGYDDGAGILAGTANPYFVRMASSSALTAGTTMITDAATQAPSFFVLWIGNNDVLSYASTGGIGVDQQGNPDPSTYGSDDITDPTAFAGVYAGLVGALTANPATQGVLVNIPDVSTIPYFTTVPYNAVPLDQATADYLNGLYAPYNGGVATALGAGSAETIKRTINFTAGQNAVIIEDEYLTDLSGGGLPSMRQATADDLLVLTAKTEIGLGGGTAYALGDNFVLIPEEKALVAAATSAFNANIKAAADANPNLILVDSSAIMQEISTTGIDYGTGAINATYATGGAFSLDGIHPTARGYAVVANRIIDAINDGFNASIPAVNPGDYSTIFVK